MAKLVVLLLACFSLTANAEEHGRGLKVPANWQQTAVWDNVQPVSTLPTKWNWNDYARLQPIRNQGGCGSCWAFSVTAVVESLHRLLYPMLYPVIDLAEQTLVSTCESGGDCGGGFFDAFNYTRDKGLPIERDDPYRASNSGCKSNLQPFTKITRWAYIGGGENSSPTTEQLKQAIYDHGPISVDVNGSWPDSSSVVTSCGSTSQDHMVDIEGWVDDPQYASYGGGYWIVRNSWGANWGDAGRIKLVYKSRGGGKCYGIGATGAYAVMNNIENVREYLGL